MSQIIVKSQKEWDNVPKKFDGYIYIESKERIVIAERKGFRVVAQENASVEAWGNASVEAWGNASVVAQENASVVAQENASVEAWGNASVVAWGNASVEAWGNAQIAKYSDFAKLQTRGNARIVTLPQTAEEYCDFYGLEIREGNAILHKAVRDDLSAFHTSHFKYQVGGTFTETCDQSKDRDCSHGLHLSHLNWAIDFGRGRSNFKIIECAVPLDKIVVPHNTDGKVRTSELTVLREVPQEEWGLYWKIISRRNQ